jgi:predicted amidohydrolase YtcJ
MNGATRWTRREALLSGLGAFAAGALGGAAALGRRAAAQDPPVPGGGGAATAADVIFTGGPILTMSDALPRAEALAVRRGRISAVGRLDEVMAQKGTGTRLVDLGGRALLPGFFEPHTHVVGSAATANFLDVSIFSGVSTADEVLARIRDAVGKANPGEWVLVKGFDPSLQSGPSALTIRDLDPIAPNNPVFLLNPSGHIAYVNSKALAAAGVTANTPDPPHASYQRDAQGAPTGVLEEPPAFTAFLKAMPQPTPQDLERAMRGTLDRAAAAGCTALNDAGIGVLAGTSDLALLQRVIQDDPPARMTGFLVSTSLDDWTQMGLTPNTGDDRLRLLGMKFWSDGSNQGETGYLREPYLNSTSRGTANYTLEQLTEGMQQAHDRGWQIAVHANGDAAIDLALSAYETILKKSPRTDHRHRIEHCSLAHPDQIAKMKALGVLPTFLIGHVYFWGRAFRDRVIGPERAANLDPTADALNAGLQWSMHSDFDVTPIQPLQYVETAVTRLMRDGGQVLGPNQRVPVEAALKAVTIQPAYQCRLETITGSLEVGKYADLVLLDKDPTAVDPTTISGIKVWETWVGGYQRFTG